MYGVPGAPGGARWDVEHAVAQVADGLLQGDRIAHEPEAGLLQLGSLVSTISI